MDKPKETVTNFIVFMAAPEFLIARVLPSKDHHPWKAICLFCIGVVVFAACRGPAEPAIPSTPSEHRESTDGLVPATQAAIEEGAATGEQPAVASDSDARSADNATEPTFDPTPPPLPAWAACSTIGEWAVNAADQVVTFRDNGALTIDADQDDDDRSLQWYREGMLVYFSADTTWACGILEGAYVVEFNDACTTLRLGRMHDECTARSTALNNIGLTRIE